MSRLRRDLVRSPSGRPPSAPRRRSLAGSRTRPTPSRSRTPRTAAAATRREVPPSPSRRTSCTYIGARRPSSPRAAVRQPRGLAGCALARRARASAGAYRPVDSAPHTPGSTPAALPRTPPASFGACFLLPFLRSSARSGPSCWLRSATSGGGYTSARHLCGPYMRAPSSSPRHTSTGPPPSTPLHASGGGAARITDQQPSTCAPPRPICHATPTGPRRSPRQGARYSSHCAMGIYPSDNPIPSRSQSMVGAIRRLESER
jgi:hypothetical protein